MILIPIFTGIIGYFVIGFFTVGPIRDLSKSPIALELSKSGGWFWGLPIWPYVVIAQAFWAFRGRNRSNASTNVFKIVSSGFRGRS